MGVFKPPPTTVHERGAQWPESCPLAQSVHERGQASWK